MHIQVKQRKKLPNTYELKQATMPAVGERCAIYMGLAHIIELESRSETGNRACRRYNLRQTQREALQTPFHSIPVANGDEW